MAAAPPHNNDAAQLLYYLQTHDVPCPLCKYNLRNLTEPRCPECGNPIELAVTIARIDPEPPQSNTLFRPASGKFKTRPSGQQHMILLTALLPPAGLGILFDRDLLKTGIALYDSLHGRDLAIAIAFQISPFLALMALAFHRKFRAIDRDAQTLIATVAALASLTLYIAFFMRTPGVL